MEFAVAGCRHNKPTGSTPFHSYRPAWPLEDSGFQGKPATHMDTVMNMCKQIIRRYPFMQGYISLLCLLLTITDDIS